MAADMDDPRPDPDALLEAADRAGRGRLKIFLGAAPGVGKTWEMLAAARHRRDEGMDVVAGVVETHGRVETAAQLGNLPVLPRRAIAYRGQVLEEFDLEAAIARAPTLLLVDELAHTNAPGSRHRKRWEDVADLLAAGIDVWCTLNVQHLESLNDAVARITGVRVGETLPDRVLELADEIELIDLPAAELRARLQEGKIYRADVAARALRGFFREGNLAALREMALRRAAEHVDENLRAYMRANAIAGPWPAQERVLALIGNDAGAEAVVRHAKRLADALRAPWMALHVEHRQMPVAASTLEARAPLTLAAELGASVETRAGADLVETALDLARRQNVTQIVMGRTRSRWWRRWTGRTLGQTLLRHGGEFALHMVAETADRRAPPRPRLLPRGWLPWVVSSVLVAAVVVAGEALHPWVEHEALGMVFLAAVVGAATLYGLAVGLYAAVLGFLSWNFFFIPPIYQLTIEQPRDVIAIVVFAGVAAATGGLASRVRAEGRIAQSRIEGLRRIAGFSRKLGEPTTEPELLAEIARQAAGVAGRAVLLSNQDGDLVVRAMAPEDIGQKAAAQPDDAKTAADLNDSTQNDSHWGDEGSWAAARWAFDSGEAAGRGTPTLPSAPWRLMPMRTLRGVLGVLGVQRLAADTPGGRSTDLDQPQLQALAALADQAAVALERVRLANSAARSEAQAETQKLRTALLNSLSHDLRTPLTSIRGAADTLRSAWDQLQPPTRDDLLASIGEDTSRMTRFLTNIMDMTRLEGGEIVPHRVPIAAGEIIEAAIARVPGAAHAALWLAPGLPMLNADPALLEQVLVNVLDNAAKYGPPGGLIRINAVAEPGGETGSICITIGDEGVGIPAEDLPHVFDSFYRAGRGDRILPGTGLGLAIARGLVEAMGGSIRALSPRPEAPADGAPGTAVEIRLPQAAARSLADATGQVSA